MTSPFVLHTCAHYWVIDTPSGPTSKGVCKLCGAVREFRNSLPNMGWEREAGAGHAHAEDREPGA
ncbi:MAG: hypothetical protein HY686_02250 [Chloroflexi bacterium]|nr:hypothetical protein [Chloroflexota bacterium]